MKETSLEEKKEQYDTITVLYDVVDELTDGLEGLPLNVQGAVLDSAEPFLGELTNSTEVLADEYITISKEPASKKSSKGKIEKALRKIFMALEAFQQQMMELGNGVLSLLSTTIDPVLVKLKKQTEKILLIFMQMLEISLDRIIRKHEVDEFRRNNREFINNLPQVSH